MKRHGIRNRWTAASAAALLLLGAIAAYASNASDDAGIQSAIEHQLVDEGIRNLQVRVADGTVTLTGTVTNLWEKSRAEDIVSDHDDVKNVVDQITVESTVSDQSIAEQVAHKLANYINYTVFDNVNVRVLNGVVTLTGDVTWGFKATEMAKVASRVPGVKQVENKIDVLPVSSNDQEIRASLSSRLYGDSMFVRYATQPNPPIHIIVENGKVTLTGEVTNAIEKRRAEIIVRDTPGVFQVTNDLRVSSEAGPTSD
jgi:osmotically-inducible protein OsmY